MSEKPSLQIGINTDTNPMTLYLRTGDDGDEVPIAIFLSAEYAEVMEEMLCHMCTGSVVVTGAKTEVGRIPERGGDGEGGGEIALDTSGGKPNNER